MADSFDPYRKWLGIPRKDQPANHYRLLGIDLFEPDAEVIAHAADARMVHLKTFQAGKYSELSQKILNEIATAKVCLLNAEKKAAYDELLRRELGPKSPVVAKAVVVAPAAARSAGTPEPMPAAVPSFTSQRASSYLAGRRKRSWQVPVVLAGLALAAALVLAFSLMGDGEPAVARRPSAPKAAPQTPRKQRPASVPKTHKPEGPAEANPVKPEEDPAAGVKSPATADAQSPAEAPPTESVDPTDPEVPATVVEKPQDPDGSEGPKVEIAKPPDESPVLAEKLAVPEEARRQDSEQRIREIFRAEFAAARTPEKRLALAEKLLQQGDETRDDPAARYVLFRLASVLAAEAGELDTALEAVDRIAAQYEANAPAMKADAVQKAVESGPGGEESARRLVEAARSTAGEAVAADDYPTANRLARMAVAAARKTKDSALSREIGTWAREVERLEKRFEQLKKNLELLAQDPENPDANLAVGRWYSMAVGRWERGLVYLAKGSDAALAGLARRDLAAPSEPNARMELANQWWELAEKQQGEARTAMMSRAAHWYELALPDLTGLSKTQAEKRLEQYAALSVGKASAGKKKGKFALAFDGQKSHVLVPDFGYDGTAPLTVEAIVIPASVDRSSTIVGNLGEGGWGLGVFDLGRFGMQNRHWAFFFRTDSGPRGPGRGPFQGGGRFPMGTGSNTPAMVNQRVMLAGVYDGQQLRFYLNGQRQLLAPPVRGRHQPGAGLLVIGGAPGSGEVPKDLFHGTIEQVRISFVARYAANYAARGRLEKDKLTQLLFHLDEGEGAVAHDSSGHKRHGKIVDAEWVKRQ